MLFFGGTNDITRIQGREDAFARAFSPECNKIVLAAVGAAPITRACLTYNMFCHDSEDDPSKHVVYNKIQASNDTTCDLFTTRGFGGSNLKAVLNRNLLTPVTVTKPDSKERIQALAEAMSDGARCLIPVVDTCVQMILSRPWN